MLDELLAHGQVTEKCLLRSRVGFMAIHGGIEEGTAELATAAARAASASLYKVEVDDGLWWHVPSIQFDPAVSRQLAAFLEHVHVVFSVHGYGRRELGDTVLLGGTHRPLADTLAHALRLHTDLAVITDLDRIPVGLRGLHPDNPVNLPRDGGVQVELPPSARTGETATGVVTALVEVARRLERDPDHLRG